MLDFIYHMPTKIYAGEEIVRKQSKLLSNYGNKALIITGKHSAKANGALKDVVAALESCNIIYTIFDKIEENPSTETVEEAAVLGRAEEVDFIVAIGGGSPLDAAKAIGVMIYHKNLTGDTLFSKEILTSIPIIAIPTTSGTGSEVTPYAIITDHYAKTKRNLGQRIFPQIAFLDARYNSYMPDKVTLDTALDAMNHLVESYLSKKSNIMTEMFVEKGLTLWKECIPAMLKKEFPLSVREKLMMTSTFAGIAIAQTGTSLPHGMGYSITYFKGISHGIANTVLYPGYLNSFKDKTKIQNILSIIGVDTIDDFCELLKQLVMQKVTLTDEEIKTWSKNFYHQKEKLKNHLEVVTEEDIYNIYKNIL